MKREAIGNILNFMVEKEGQKIPKRWADLLVREEEQKELIRALETHPDGSQFVHEGSLYFHDNVNITKLPNDLVVNGNIYLYDNPNTIELPKKLLVRGFLDLRDCNQITKLPDNLYVNDWLDLDNCEQITEFPKRLYVGGNLYIRNTSLAKKYTKKEIRDIVASTGGEIKEQIIMY